MEYTARYLVKVEPGANNNKWYKCEPHGDTWTAKWGRVGNDGQQKDYPRSMYEKKLNEKLKKGYVDQTSLVQDLIVEKKASGAKGFKDIEDAAIREIVRRLQSFAKSSVEKNYEVSSDKVTQAMVDEAQKILDNLAHVKDLGEFNETLVKLFRTIPRKMDKVQHFLAENKSQYHKIISREQDTLDVMRGQVIQRVTADGTDVETNDGAKTILDSLGMQITPCTAEDVKNIKNHLGRTLGPKFKNAWRVVNLKTQKAYDDFVKANDIKVQKMYWHGSRNENWWSILQLGLLIRPSNAVYTGSMFGDACYASPTAMKSYGYTSGRGSCWANGSSSSAFMMVMDAAYGIPYDVYSFDPKYCRFNWDKLRQAKPGATCLHAHAGSMLRNDEVVFYRTDQLTIHYLVELAA